VEVSIGGHTVTATEGELLVEVILREKNIPHICYHSLLMGPIETCDTAGSIFAFRVNAPRRWDWR
jgi:formate dehydrogenase major subunit